MLKVENKATKRIRVAQIVLFLVQIFLTSTPFIWGGYIDSKSTNTLTVLDMISYIGSSTGNPENDGILNTLGLCFVLFLVLPIIAVGFQLFDRKYNLKNVVGLICSGAGVVLIIYFVGPAFICYGAVVSLLLYLVSFFLSVMGIFARYLKQDD